MVWILNMSMKRHSYQNQLLRLFLGSPRKSDERIFDEIEYCKKMKTLTEAILGKDWKALYCMTMFSKKGSKGQAWHQDCPPIDTKKFNLNRLVYSMDINKQVGGEVLVMPGSHQHGTLPAGKTNENFAEQVILAPKKAPCLSFMDTHGTEFFLSKVNIGYPQIIERCQKILLRISLTFVSIATCYINFQPLKYSTIG